MLCNICPRKCNVDRKIQKGFCGMGEKPVVARAFPHMWEEPCISGTEGSGAVFFSGCNLKCIFCQNHEISHGGHGKELTAEELAGVFLSLAGKGVHNINLVTPSHFVPAIKEALDIAKGPGSAGRRGSAEPGCLVNCTDSLSARRPADPGRLSIPVVYNTNGYDSVETLRLLEGLVDIYLPDLKYVSPEVSMEYSGARDYFETASKAVLEMYRQVGDPVFGGDRMMQKGVIVRHLVLPGHIGETSRVLDWIAENLGGHVYVSLMSQYLPCYKACGHPVLGRRLTRYEYEKTIKKFKKLGLNGYVQERESASDKFIPDFS